MKDSRVSTGLKKLLSTCESLRQIRSKMADPELEREDRTRLRRQSKRKTDQLTRDFKSYQFHGPLAQIMELYPLTPDHFQILSTLLHRQIRYEDPAVEGRLILASVFECSYEVLSRIDLLRPECALREAGLMVLEDSEESPVDLLEARFTLSEEALDCFRREISGQFEPKGPEPKQPRPYKSNGEFLIDLRLLHNLYQQRSTRTFAVDHWNRLHRAAFRPGQGLNQRIDGSWERVRQRLSATDGSCEFPGVRLMREYRLSEEEIICVVHLFFKELYEGNAYADVADLLKLVSQGEADLMRNRRLMIESSPLIKRELVSIEPFLEGRTLTGEAHLNDWVVNYLFGAPVDDSDIRADERIDWHMYLAKLSDSQGFFKDLGTN
jgi:hypothetical protein